jgi:hypothetical protein
MSAISKIQECGAQDMPTRFLETQNPTRPRGVPSGRTTSMASLTTLKLCRRWTTGDQQQRRMMSSSRWEKEGKNVLDVFFVDWIDGSLNYWPWSSYINRETDLIPVGHLFPTEFYKFAMRSIEFPKEKYDLGPRLSKSVMPDSKKPARAGLYSKRHGYNQNLLGPVSLGFCKVCPIWSKFDPFCYFLVYKYFPIHLPLSDDILVINGL